MTIEWTDLARYLPGDWTEAQREAVRRAGARDRHEARVSAAVDEIDALSLELNYEDWHKTRAVLVCAIERALKYIGAPGSRSGSGPPGWYVAHPHVGARIAAMREAIGRVRSEWDFDFVHVVDVTYSKDALGLCADGCVFAQFDVCPEDYEPSRRYVLAEHLAGWAIERSAAAVARWLVDRARYDNPEYRAKYGEPYECPAPPDAALCEFHARLIERRRAPRV